MKTNRTAREAAAGPREAAPLDFHMMSYANRAALGLSYTGTPRARYRLDYGLGKESCTAG